jgi:short-subunit dehydrogenase
MSGYFHDKVAALTGAASGIALEMAEQMLAGGARAVFMGDFKEENLMNEARRLEKQYPGKVFPVLTDVTKREQVANLVESAAEYEGHLDFVCNVAGIGMTLPTEQITFEIWDSIIDLNIKGVVYGTYTAIPIMRKQGFGHIINAGSVAGLLPIPYQAVYAATKAAVISMTESLQYELETEGLQFSVFCPANVRTAIFGGLEPPPDSIGVDEAVKYILAEVERKSVLIVLPQNTRDFYDLYCRNRKDFDSLARKLAAERRENYRTKGTYF